MKHPIDDLSPEQAKELANLTHDMFQHPGFKEHAKLYANEIINRMDACSRAVPERALQSCLQFLELAVDHPPNAHKVKQIAEMIGLMLIAAAFCEAVTDDPEQALAMKSIFSHALMEAEVDFSV